MKTILLILFPVIFLAQQPGSNQPPKPKPYERFITKYDLEAHFYGSFFVNECTYQIEGLVFPEWKPSKKMLYSSLVTLSVISLKERWDMSKKHPTGWSWDDWFIGLWAIPVYLIVRVCLNDFRQSEAIYTDPFDPMIKKRNAPRKWSLKRMGFLN